MTKFRLRRRRLADGRLSLFIDHAVDGRHHYEFLRLYLLPESSERNRRANARTLREAERIRESRERDFIARAASAPDPDIRLSEFIDILIERSRLAGTTSHRRLLTLRGLLGAVGLDVPLKNVDTRFCIEFRDKLLQRISPLTGRPLAAKSRYDYFSCLGYVLAQATLAGYIRRNPWLRLDRGSRIPDPPSARGFLTLEELRRLEATPCRMPLVRQAFLFSCCCGLRLGDLRRLRRGDIVYEPRPSLRIVMRKTGRELSLPIPAHALRFLPDGETPFASLPCNSTLNRHLRRWGAEAGIGKRLHFHISRHTFGTLLVTAGVEVYTVARLMGHSGVRATQNYARIVDARKFAAMTLLDSRTQSLRPE